MTAEARPAEIQVSPSQTKTYKHSQHGLMMQTSVETFCKLACCVQSIDTICFSTLFQPQFIHLAQIWSGFQDEMVLLSVLSNILASLEPFVRGHRDIFSEEMLAPFMSDVAIKSDEERINEVGIISILCLRAQNSYGWCL